MLKALERRRRPVQSGDVERHAVSEGAQRPAGSDRLLLLISEGGLSFRLLAFPTMETARAYLRAQSSLIRPGGIIAFWALDSEAVPETYASPSQTPEAVVIVRDPERPGIVELYSFVDMAAANAFLYESVPRGMNLDRVLLYWASLTSIDITLSDPGEASVEPIRPGRTSGLVQTGPAEAPDEAKRETPSARAGILARIHSWPGWDGLAQRMLAASLLRQEIYADLARDRHATGRAALIVALGALAAGIGAFGPWHSSLLQIFAALIGWGAYLATIHVVGNWAMGGRGASIVRLFQAVGLASSPALFFVFGAVPIYGPLFGLVVSLWVMIATAKALTPVLELRDEAALLTASIAFLLYFGISQVAPAVLT